MGHSLLTIFSGSLQAALSILLTIFYGVLASYFDLIGNNAAKHISEVCVKMFLPLLLVTKVGAQVTLENVGNYGPIVAWALFYNVVSLIIGTVAVRVFKFPVWVTPAIAFNNTTSLPLLLVQSMEKTGLLTGLMRDNESMSHAIARAQSYFLVCAVVGKCLTFALGPRLLYGAEASNNRKRPVKSDNASIKAIDESDQSSITRRGSIDEETTSLLHSATSIRSQSTVHEKESFTRKTYNTTLDILSCFINAPVIGALIGIVLGLVPSLHTAFFADTLEGGIFTAWLTTSLKNTGELFVTLQVILVGIKLHSSLSRLPQDLNEDDDPLRSRNKGDMPWSAALFVFGIRYVFWPVVSMSTIYGLARSGVLGKRDAILWFSMMLMPTGPPAMTLIPMAEVGGRDEGVKISVAKLLTGMYGVSPVLSVVTAGTLKATHLAMRGR